MSLGTYLPEGEGQYILGMRGAHSFFYFIPEGHRHLKIGFLITGSGEYIDAEYKDVVIFSPDSEFVTLECGQYRLSRNGRSLHTVELSSSDNVTRYQVYAQPRLGRFRLIKLTKLQDGGHQVSRRPL